MSIPALMPVMSEPSSSGPIDPKSMTPDDLVAIQNKLGFSNGQMAALLGTSHSNLTRYREVNGPRRIPAYMARLVVALNLLDDRGLLEEFVVLATPYQAQDSDSRPLFGGRKARNA